VHRAATNRLGAVTIRIGLAGDQTERAPRSARPAVNQAIPEHTSPDRLPRRLNPLQPGQLWCHDFAA
jgi:hypothetical protein